MNDFDYEVLQKKRLAKNAKAKVNGSRSKKCTMPDDYLTPAQRAKLNGPVRTWKLDRPMLWTDFNAMPDDLQREYLQKLRDQFHVGDTQIADMMCVTHATVGKRRRELGIVSDGNTRIRPKAEQIDAFCDWIEGAIPGPETEPEEEPEQEPEFTSIPVLPRTVQVNGGSFTVTGPAQDALATLSEFFRDNTRVGAFTITYEYEKEETK